MEGGKVWEIFFDRIRLSLACPETEYSFLYATGLNNRPATFILGAYLPMRLAVDPKPIGMGWRNACGR